MTYHRGETITYNNIITLLRHVRHRFQRGLRIVLRQSCIDVGSANLCNVSSGLQGFGSGFRCSCPGLQVLDLCTEHELRISEDHACTATCFKLRCHANTCGPVFGSINYFVQASNPMTFARSRRPTVRAHRNLNIYHSCEKWNLIIGNSFASI